MYVEQWKNKLAKGKFKDSQSSGPKKNKVVWTHDLHSKFVKAIQDSGPQRCSGKKILEIMNEPGLTRKNISSHLQIFRQRQKKLSDETRTVHSVATNEPVTGFGQSNMLLPINLEIEQGGGVNNSALKHQSLMAREDHRENEKYFPYTTPAAIEVAGRYCAILEREGVELTTGTEWVEPLVWWLLPTSNGTPEPPNISILKNLAHRHRQNTSGGAGSSSSSPNASNIPDLVFVQVVRLAISDARANQGVYLRSLEDWEVEGMGRNLLEKINAQSFDSFNSIFFEEVVTVVNIILMTIRDKDEYVTEKAYKEDLDELFRNERLPG
ncbi:uncharacterized protein LOC141719265 [Apium graveolens]|uniref:uncharacterized protein LOC141719265 n=1 Tax=Apium graveolens TaxID=4045 RepID=UPI003D792B30